MGNNETDVVCSECGRLMYRATATNIKYSPSGNKKPIQLTIGNHRFLLCSRECLLAGIDSLSDEELFEGGWPLPW